MVILYDTYDHCELKEWQYWRQYKISNGERERLYKLWIDSDMASCTYVEVKLVYSCDSIKYVSGYYGGMYP